MEREMPEKYSGTLDRIRLVELVQMACLAGMDRDVAIEMSQSCVLCIRSGQVVHAAMGNLRGEEAFQEILVCESGTFRFEPAEGDVQVGIRKSWEQLLIESMGYRN